MVRSVIKITQRFTTSQQWAAFIALAILVTGLSFSYLVTGQIRQQLLTQQQALATNLVRDASILLRTSLSKDDRISANITGIKFYITRSVRTRRFWHYFKGNLD